MVEWKTTSFFLINPLCRTGSHCTTPKQTVDCQFPRHTRHHTKPAITEHQTLRYTKLNHPPNSLSDHATHLTSHSATTNFRSHKAHFATPRSSSHSTANTPNPHRILYIATNWIYNDNGYVVGGISV